MKPYLITFFLLITSYLCYGSGDIVYFLNAKDLKKLNQKIESLSKSKENYVRFIKEYETSDYYFSGAKPLDWETFKEKAKQNKQDPYFEKITWYILDKFSTKQTSDSFHEMMILFDFYYSETQTKAYKKLIKLTNSKDEKIRKQAMLDLLKYNNKVTPDFHSVSDRKSFDKLKLSKELRDEAFLLYCMNFNNNRDHIFQKTLPTFIISSHEFTQGYLSYSDQKKIKRIGEGGYFDYVIEHINNINENNTYYDDKEYFINCVKEIERRLNILNELGEGSIIIHMFND